MLLVNISVLENLCMWLADVDFVARFPYYPFFQAKSWHTKNFLRGNVTSELSATTTITETSSAWLLATRTNWYKYNGGSRLSDKGGGGHPEPEIRGGRSSQIKSFWSKIKGGPGPPGLSLYPPLKYMLKAIPERNLYPQGNSESAVHFFGRFLCRHCTTKVVKLDWNCNAFVALIFKIVAS